MRFELLLFLSLACLAFTAQTAPASAKDALQEQKHKQRDSEPHKHKPKSGPRLHRHPKQHHYKSSHLGHGNNLKYTRGLTSYSVEVVQDTKTLFVPEHESKLRAKIDAIEKTSLEKEKLKQHEIERADIIETAKHGAVPPKFPLVTRISSFIGIVAAIANVANFIFAVKTTALATKQFSAPPTPPTFIDTAGRWDGQQYQLMPLPQEPDDTKSARKKRSLPDECATVPPAHKRMVKRKRPHHTEQSQKLDEAQHDPKLSKRFVTAAGVGLLLGGAISPGMPSLVMGWKPEVDKTPFDPYDPNVLKPKDPFAVAAADPDHALPALPMRKPAPSGSSNGLPSLRNIVFPASAYSSSATSILQQQQQQLTAATAQQGSAISSANVPARGSSTASASDEVQTVLRKRSVEAKHSTEIEHQVRESSKPLEKRFLFGKGPVGKVTGAVALGSILYVLYKGVSHSRWRQENPRDRDILKDLDDTPMYGAVGVPKRIPGQLATKAMPGYSDYVAKLAAQQQTQQQAAMQQQQWQQLATTQAQARDALTEQAIAAQSSSGGVGVAAADAGSNDPVLRRRSSDASSAVSAKPVFGDAGQTRLDKRGGRAVLIGGGLTVIGIALGYLQSATMFPTDRDEEKDKKKRERKKQQEQQLLMQQQQALVQGQAAQSAGMGYAPSGASAPLVSSSDGGGIAFPSSAYSSSGSTYPPSMGAGSFSSSAGTESSTGGASSASAALNAAAGYSSAGGSASGSVLKKRDISGHPDQESETRSLSKRSPGVGSFLSIAGTTMFFGTLAGNLIVGEKEKHKPVPYVTPNADTRGPMVPGGELYTQYLQSKRPPSTSGDAFGDVGASLATGTPASITGQNMAPASAPASIYGQTPVVGSQLGANTGTAASPNAPDVGRGGEADPVLKKRHSPRLEKRVPLSFAGARAEAAAGLLTKGVPMVEAEVGAASALSRSAALSEAGAASRFAPTTRFSSLSGVRGGAAASEAGFAGLGRASMAGEGSTAARIYQPNAAAVGSARPAMLSDLGGASGRAGTPATFARSASTRQLSPAEMQGQQQRVAAGQAADMNPGVKGMSGQAPEEAKKGWTSQKVLGIVGGAAGATMLFPGAG
ncbi:uncharacterized protein UHO2_04437 [Ustilago hordei]|uniref:Uncharacterized protein n=1 Tax=Ustilago hordei TaxID=120017 RepID=I2FVG2_USTHO|nr:uncharacterized protein UHO2_04437 [Ustilago hordei]CCF50905.1 uncharacterized protein UHOR_06791 [Ustilago hordei]SYW84498.1 uncharacterized protein UHO2_04437 [Ustilago hordei]